eukprot:Platyproteum_vivax@DN1070_c0_g1_i1.p1
MLGAKLEHIFAGLLGVTVCFVGVRAYLMASRTVKPESKTAKLITELQRKTFHIVGGVMLSGGYYYCLKYNLLSSPHAPLTAAPSAMDAGVFFMLMTLSVWTIEVLRLSVPPIQNLYMTLFKDLVREKEIKKAAGIAFFLPGVLAAVIAFPSNHTILGVLYLTAGDTAASLGTALGNINIGSSTRKVEGTIGCFLVCLFMGWYVGLPMQAATSGAVFASLSEVMAELMGLDDNLVVPTFGCLGIKLGMRPPNIMSAIAAYGIGIAGPVCLGVSVGSLIDKTKKSIT